MVDAGSGSHESVVSEASHPSLCLEGSINAWVRHHLLITLRSAIPTTGCTLQINVDNRPTDHATPIINEALASFQNNFSYPSGNFLIVSKQILWWRDKTTPSLRILGYLQTAFGFLWCPQEQFEGKQDLTKIRLSKLFKSKHFTTPFSQMYEIGSSGQLPKCIWLLKFR